MFAGPLETHMNAWEARIHENGLKLFDLTVNKNHNLKNCGFFVVFCDCGLWFYFLNLCGLWSGLWFYFVDFCGNCGFFLWFSLWTTHKLYTWDGFRLKSEI